MKQVLSILSAIIILITASVSSAKAQVSVSVNIGAQPMWAPVGYSEVDYYYLPDIECYYYVPRHQFVYLSGPNWVFSYNLPSRCRGYDLYSGYKVVCHEPRPYMNFYHDRVAYARYRGYHGHQQVWRDYRGGHGGGNYYVEERRHGNGNGWGHYKHGGGGHGHGRGHGRW
jgi:hypothetical protein